MSNYENLPVRFCMYVEITDAEQLKAAALARWNEENPNCSPESGGFDPDDAHECLIQLLDPGMLAGCSILDSCIED